MLRDTLDRDITRSVGENLQLKLKDTLSKTRADIHSQPSSSRTETFEMKIVNVDPGSFQQIRNDTGVNKITLKKSPSARPSGGRPAKSYSWRIVPVEQLKPDTHRCQAVKNALKSDSDSSDFSESIIHTKAEKERARQRIEEVRVKSPPLTSEEHRERIQTINDNARLIREIRNTREAEVRQQKIEKLIRKKKKWNEHYTSRLLEAQRNKMIFTVQKIRDDMSATDKVLEKELHMLLNPIEIQDGEVIDLRTDYEKTRWDNLLKLEEERRSFEIYLHNMKISAQERKDKVVLEMVSEDAMIIKRYFMKQREIIMSDPDNFQVISRTQNEKDDEARMFHLKRLKEEYEKETENNVFETSETSDPLVTQDPILSQGPGVEIMSNENTFIESVKLKRIEELKRRIENTACTYGEKVTEARNRNDEDRERRLLKSFNQAITYHEREVNLLMPRSSRYYRYKKSDFFKPILFKDKRFRTTAKKNIDMNFSDKEDYSRTQILVAKQIGNKEFEVQVRENMKSSGQRLSRSASYLSEMCSDVSKPMTNPKNSETSNLKSICLNFQPVVLLERLKTTSESSINDDPPPIQESWRFHSELDLSKPGQRKSERLQKKFADKQEKSSSDTQDFLWSKWNAKCKEIEDKHIAEVEWHELDWDNLETPCNFDKQRCKGDRRCDFCVKNFILDFCKVESVPNSPKNSDTNAGARARFRSPSTPEFLTENEIEAYAKRLHDNKRCDPPNCTHCSTDCLPGSREWARKQKILQKGKHLVSRKKMGIDTMIRRHVDSKKSCTHLCTVENCVITKRIARERRQFLEGNDDPSSKAISAPFPEAQKRPSEFSTIKETDSEVISKLRRTDSETSSDSFASDKIETLFSVKDKVKNFRPTQMSVKATATSSELPEYSNVQRPLENPRSEDYLTPIAILPDTQPSCSKTFDTSSVKRELDALCSISNIKPEIGTGTEEDPVIIGSALFFHNSGQILKINKPYSPKPCRHLKTDTCATCFSSAHTSSDNSVISSCEKFKNAKMNFEKLIEHRIHQQIHSETEELKKIERRMKITEGFAKNVKEIAESFARISFSPELKRFLANDPSASALPISQKPLKLPCYTIYENATILKTDTDKPKPVPRPKEPDDTDSDEPS